MDVLIAKRELMIKIGFQKFTSKGYAWLATNNGWKDLASGLTWKYEDEEGTFVFDEAVAKFGASLPTKKEYEEAEKHGIREVLLFDKQYYWSASVYSNYQSNAWYFYSLNGNVFIITRYNTNSVRCVGR